MPSTKRTTEYFFLMRTKIGSYKLYIKIRDLRVIKLQILEVLLFHERGYPDPQDPRMIVTQISQLPLIYTHNTFLAVKAIYYTLDQRYFIESL